MKKIVAVIPAFNKAAKIKQVIQGVLKA